MAAVLTQEHDPYLDGLGKSSQLGVCFLRRITVDCNSSVTTATFANTDIAVAKFVRVVSIVPKSNHSVYNSALSETSVSFVASANTAVFDVFILCAGM